MVLYREKFRINRVTDLKIVGTHTHAHARARAHARTHARTHTHYIHRPYTPMPILGLDFLRKAETRLKSASF